MSKILYDWDLFGCGSDSGAGSSDGTGFGSGTGLGDGSGFSNGDGVGDSNDKQLYRYVEQMGIFTRYSTSTRILNHYKELINRYDVNK